MLYIKEISKVNDVIKNLKVIYSIERKDIEFMWSVDTVIHGINKGNKYRTVYYNSMGILTEGSDVEVVVDGENSYLRTVSNNTENDNLSRLPIFN